MPFAIPALVLKWWKLAAGMILGAALCFPLAQCDGKRIGRQQMQLALEQANTKALKQTAIANERAAEQRLTDTVAVSTREEALLDAIQSTPDSAPDAARIALGCARLRASGQSTAAIPACRGP